MAFFISFGRLSLTLGSLLLCVLHGIFMSLVVRFMILAQFWIVGRFLDWLLFHGFFVLDRCLEWLLSAALWFGLLFVSGYCDNWRLFFGFGLASLLEALVLAYGLNASTWICFLWFEDTSHGYASLLVCHWFFLSRLGIGGHHFYLWKLGFVASWSFWCEVCSTFDLLPLLTMALPCIWFFLSRLGIGRAPLLSLEPWSCMTSFHCRLWLFLALLFGYHHWFWISLFFLSCASILSSWELLMVKRCASIGFVDIGFYRMVVKRCLVASSFNWFNLELWLLLVG